MSAPAIGIDVGGTKIAAAVVAPDGDILARTTIATSPDAPNAIATGIVKIALELRASAPAVASVGVGLAGLVDSARGVVRAAPNMAYRNLDVGGLLRERLRLPVFVDNDANAAAWGEARFGAGRGHGDQVMVTVGTGIGGGLIIGGRIYRGARGIGAEVGHLIVDASGPPCGCGARGCLETLASGNAIGRIARERLAAGEGKRSVLEGRAAGLTGAAVGEAAVAGDAFARSVLATAGASLGVGLASI
ncbi:MAG: ROK family protein, partial [Actinomycetota bacterium]